MKCTGQAIGLGSERTRTAPMQHLEEVEKKQDVIFYLGVMVVACWLAVLVALAVAVRLSAVALDIENKQTIFHLAVIQPP